MTATSSTALEHEIGLTGLLAVRLRDGSVHLRAVDGPVVRVHDDRGEVEGAFSIDRATGSLALRSGHTGSFGAHPPDLVIDVPRRATVVIESASGDLQADGLRGDQRFRTASGDVTLREVGGALSIEAVSGDVEITAVDDSSISARTVSGDLAIRAATIESLRLSTTSGDLRLAGHLAGSGPFSIETVSGDTLLAVAGDVRIEMQTVAGDMRSEIEARTEGGRGRRIMTVGSGGPTLAVRSMSGDLRVVRALGVTRPDAQDAPEAPGSTERPMPIAPTVVVAGTSDPSDISDAAEAARLDILRSLERGEIDVAEAGRRLEALEATTAEDGTDA
jgi:hypothetical protein